MSAGDQPVSQRLLKSRDPDRRADRARPPHIEIRHLAALAAIAHERSIRAAARRLGCSQSTVSQRLVELEGAFGAELVIRRRGLSERQLTDAGRSLLFHAEAVMDRIEAARADLAALEEQSDLRVGVYEGAPLRLLPTILGRLGGIKVTPREGRDDLELLAALRFGDLDLTFATLPLPAGPFDYVRLLEEPYVLLAPKDDSERRTVDALAGTGKPLLAYSNPQVLRTIERHLGFGEIALRLVEEPGSAERIRSRVLAGDGAALLPQHEATRDSGAAVISLAAVLPLYTTVVAWHRDRQLPASAERFREVAVEVFARAAGTDRPS